MMAGLGRAGELEGDYRLDTQLTLDLTVGAQHLLRNLADVGELRIDHLRAARLGNLAEKHIRFRRRHAVVVLHPIDHFLESDAHCIFKRPRTANCADMGRRFDPRPCHPLRGFLDAGAYREYGCDFNRSHAVALAIPLDGVAVAQEEMCTLTM